MIEFPRPALPAKIAAPLFSPSRLAIFEWLSPKSFRVESGLAWLIEKAFAGTRDQNFWWVGPDFSACNIAQTILRSGLTPGSFTIPGRAPATVLINGATIHFRNADNIGLLYSDSVFACVVDQAVLIHEKAWSALRDTLANTRAPVRIISTVAGRDNWFHNLARRAESGDEKDLIYTRFNALDALEEDILSQDDIDYARASLPDHVFRALYLAQPYDDRIESAYKANDPKLMTDAELAIIAGLDPQTIGDVSSSFLEELAISGIRNTDNSY